MYLPCAFLSQSDNPAHSRMLLDCLILSFTALVVLLLAVRRLNRFEREYFVSSFFLHTKVCVLRAASRDLRAARNWCLGVSVVVTAGKRCLVTVWWVGGDR